MCSLGKIFSLSLSRSCFAIKVFACISAFDVQSSSSFKISNFSLVLYLATLGTSIREKHFTLPPTYHRSKLMFEKLLFQPPNNFLQDLYRNFHVTYTFDHEYNSKKCIKAKLKNKPILKDNYSPAFSEN